MSDFNPSNVEILKAEIQTYDRRFKTDITTIIGGLSLSQSLDSYAWSGVMTILDTNGFIERTPIRGEEYFNLVIKSFDLNYTIDLKARIFKVENVRPTGNDDGVLADIHFMSEVSYDAAKRKIIKSFNEVSASDISKIIFNDYFTEINQTPKVLDKERLPFKTKKYAIKNDPHRHFYIQPSEGTLRALIPNFIPFDAMNWLSQKSYSANSKSSSYRYFETFSSFNFVTDEFLIKRGAESGPKQLFHNTFTKKDGKHALEQIKTIESISNPSRVDTSSDIHSGAYVNNFIEIDLIRRKVTQNFFNNVNAGFIDMNGKINSKEKTRDSIHTKKFREDTFTKENARRFISFKDFTSDNDIQGGSLRGDQYYNEILSNRISYRHILNGTKTTIGIKGRLDFEPGQIVNLAVTGLSESGKEMLNEQLSGNYLIHSVDNTINKGSLFTSLTLLKYSWST